MKTKKRIYTVISLMLIMLMILTVSAGCTQNNENNENQDNNNQSTDSNENEADSNENEANSNENETDSNENEADSNENEAEDEEPFEMSMLARYFGAEYPAVESEFFEEIQKRTNTKIDFEFVPAADYTEKFDVKLASKQMASINMVANTKASNVARAVENGAFWVAGDYYIGNDDYPYLQKIMDTSIEFTKVNGEAVFIPIERVIGRPTFIYRKDLAKNQGITKVPETTEEFYDLVVALSKETDFGMALSQITPPKNQWAVFSRMAVWFGAPNGFGIEDGKMVYAPTTDGWKDAMDFVKKLYDEELINTDFAAITDQKTNELFWAGKAGGAHISAGDIPRSEDKIKAIEPDVEIGAFGALDGGEGKRAIMGTGLGGSFGISKDEVKTEEEVKRILKYFDDISHPELMGFMQRGFVGDFYEWVEEGKTVKLIEGHDADLRARTASVGYVITLNLNNVTPIPSAVTDQRVVDTRKENYEYGVADAAYPYPSETYNEIGPQLDNIVVDATVKYIFGEYDMDEYNKEIENWYSMGGTKVIEEYQAAYDKANK